MAGSIHILDDDVVDKIAAGEVVERPASIVKELLENAIDASATSVTVEVEGGGVGLVRITDDGVGMTPTDAVLSLRRHATSKLSSADDLSAITTLGFRGEALPSIAAVSRFTLTTRTREQNSGTRLVIAGGSAARQSEVGCAPGTSVEAKDLFFNVPARRKFLKSSGTESAHISSVCLRAALVFPGLRLVLLRDGRKALEYLPVGSFLERVKSAYPDEKLISIETERGGLRITAALGAPERARSGAAGLHLFVNRRPVRDPALARAVVYAYGSVLPPGRHPIGAVHLEMDPAAVDVNVHPQKLEVRFADARAVLDTVTRALAAELGTSAWSGPAARGASYWSQRLSSNAATPAARSGESPGRIGDLNRVLGPLERPWEPDPWGLRPAETEDAAAWPALSKAEAVGVADSAGAALRAEPEQTAMLPVRGFYRSLRVLGQVRQEFLICVGADALYVLDQHAADERVKFDRLRDAFRSRQVKTQRLLFPARVECSAEEMALVEERLVELAAAGLECGIMGESTVAVSAIPALLGRAAPERLLRDLLTQLDRKGERAFDAALDRGLATMACHGAIRTGDSLSLEEAAALLDSLDEVSDFSSYCPHGRPVVFTISFDELERRLGR